MATIRRSGYAIAALLAAAGGVGAQQTQTAPAAPAAADTLASERLETDFSVHRGALKIVHGGKKAALADQAFITAALRDRKVSLRHCDYHARVSTASLNPTNAGDKPMVVQLVALDALSCRDNPTAANYVAELAGTEFRRGAVSYYEHPTTCYDFVVAGKLMFMCHYGSAAYTGIDLAPVVAQLKAAPRR